VGDFSGTDSFNSAFFCFRFAAWESAGTSSVGSTFELDDVSVESGEGSLFRFEPEAAGNGFGLAGDIQFNLGWTPSGRHYLARSVSVPAPAAAALIYGPRPSHVFSFRGILID
jgi:hypothetical protein